MTDPFRLLVAYDGSVCADDMIDELDAAGIPGDAHALVVSVAERWLPPPSMYEVATARDLPRGREQASRLARLGANRLAERHPRWTVEAEGHAGSPARVIVDRAREWHARLIAVGALGHNIVERLLIGSVSQKIVNEASCSVRVSRGQSRPGAQKLLLAYDARPGAELAAGAIAARSWPKGTEVHVVAGVGFDGAPLGELSLPLDLGRAQELLQPAVRTLERAGLSVSATLREADPKHLVVEEAARLGADCIFAGCNEHSLLDRILLGTVSNALVARARCTVEVVR
jgi:nucleotide-binding universal stress UspA family protein